MKLIVTGGAGFIGFHLIKKLLEMNEEILCIDNINDYYDINLKTARLDNLKRYSKDNHKSFIFKQESLENNEKISEIFNDFNPEIVVNLAAQAGVRYSLINPSAYIQSNLVGFANILDNCKNKKVKHLIYASSSSVYGGNKKFPFSETDGVNHPVSLYAASKKSNELMAHSYSHIYNLPTTGLRFFTVYGPWGRPDMALFLFTKAIIEGRPIDIYNHGRMIRDFTYIDDIVASLIKIINKPATSNQKFDFKNPDPSTSWAPYRIFNIGNSKPTNLMDYIKAIENSLNKESEKNFMDLQPGDVTETSSNTELLENWIKFKPNTSIEVGIKNFINWYKDYYSLN